MVKTTLTTTWVNIVAAGNSYLLQGIKGEDFLVINSASQPVDAVGFRLNQIDSLSSIAYPTPGGLWARALSGTVDIIVDSWA